jgi:hypothetical protein
MVKGTECKAIAPLGGRRQSSFRSEAGKSSKGLVTSVHNTDNIVRVGLDYQFD